MSYIGLRGFLSWNTEKNPMKRLQSGKSSCYSYFLAAAHTGFSPKRRREQLDKFHRLGQEARAEAWMTGQETDRV